MRSASWMLALALLLGTGTAHAQDNPAQLLEKAITAHGGEANLAKYPARTWKAKGKVHIQGMEINFTGDWAMSGQDKMKTAIEVDANGQTFQFGMVLNGTEGWRKLGDNVNDMSKEEVERERSNTHAASVGRLLPLKDKAYTLTMLKETMVEGKPAVGFNVARQGYKDVKMYFDKDSSLLVKTEFDAFDMNSGGDVKQEGYMSNYKDVQGVKVAMKQVVKREGAVFVESETTEIKLLEKLDDSTFKKPE